MNPRLRLGSIFFTLSSDFFLHILKSYSDIVQYLLEEAYMGRTRPTRELEHDLLKLAFCEFQVFGTLKLILLLAGIWYLLVSSQILYLYRALQMLYL